MGIYNVHAGHCPQGQGASGAVGILKESVEDRLVKNEVIRLLREKGNTVYDCTVDYATTALGCLQGIVKKCNAHNVLIDMSIHLNSGRNDLVGDGVTAGTEVYLFPGASPEMVKIATQICANISADLGIKNRGVKYRKNLYVLRHTKAPAMLVECCFVDDKDDADRWDALKCANAIVNGILSTNNAFNGGSAEPVPQPIPQPSGKLTVDGWWGVDTTKATQKLLNTPVDGIVSGQYQRNMRYLKHAKGGWQYSNSPKGSTMMKALQTLIGVSADGIAGRDTVRALQHYLNRLGYTHLTEDGYLGYNTVRTWQIHLNANV